MIEELERVLNNVNGEIPGIQPEQIIVKDFVYAEQVLEDLKAFMIAFLENNNLDIGDPKWKVVLPQRLVSFTDQLNEADFYLDDIAQPLNAIIYSMKRTREWKWFSSSLESNGFIINVSGEFNLLICLPHCMGIPHNSLFVKNSSGIHEINALQDVLTYRTWNHETFEMGPVPDGTYPETINWTN
jgi:hypothetical protein